MVVSRSGARLGAFALPTSIAFPRFCPMRFLPPIAIEARYLPTRWDILAAVLVCGFSILFAETSRILGEPLKLLTISPVSLDPADLPEYALRTAFRMLIAMAF